LQLSSQWPNSGISQDAQQEINKENMTYSVEYYSAIKKNEIMSFSGKWMELEVIMLRERS
jgi:hypothetical protein